MFQRPVVQLRILLLAAAMMAWLIQPALAARSDSRDIVHLAANLVWTAGLVETLSDSTECRSRTDDSTDDSDVAAGHSRSISIERSIEDITQDLPSLYLSASARSVAAAITSPKAHSHRAPENTDAIAESCRRRVMQFTSQYLYFRDRWSQSVETIRALPEGEVVLIRQLDAGLIGTSPEQKRKVFERIDALAAKLADDFGRALKEQSTISPATLDQKYF